MFSKEDGVRDEDGGCSCRLGTFIFLIRRAITNACTGAADPVGLEWKVTWRRPMSRFYRQ